MKVFKVGDIVTFKDQYDPGCTGDDYPHLFPSSCKGCAGVITAVLPDTVDSREKSRKMYNHDDYLYEVKITSNDPAFNQRLRRARWHGSCFKEYGTEPNVLLYRKDTRVLVKRIPGVSDWRENYSPCGVIRDDVYTRNKDNFCIIVKDLPDKNETTTFYVGDEDVEPLETVQKSPSVEKQLSKIDDFISKCEELDTPPEPQVSKKPIIMVSIKEVKITIPKTVLPTIKI